MLAFSLLATLVVSTSAPQDEEVGEAAVPIEFAWPSEGRVAVFEAATKRAGRLAATYDVVWAPPSSGDGIRVTLENYEVLNINGIDATDPRLEEGIGPLRAIGAATPAFLVDDEGTLVEVESMGPILEHVGEVMTEKLGAEEVEPVMAMLRQPAMQAMLEEKAGERWGYWVGNWIGFELEAETEAVWEIDTEISGGVMREIEITCGAPTRIRGVEAVELSMHMTADEDLLRRMLATTMGVIAEGADVELPEDVPLERATKTVTVRGTYAIDQFRPLEVHTSDSSHIWMKGLDEAQERLEEHSYYFDWPGVEPHGKGE